MLELAVLHNGGSDLPTVTAPSGVQICGGSLAERFESYRRETINQIRQGILAEELGFHYWFLTEHHFQPEGAEYSPNPLMTEMAIAARTKRIRLGQLANILAWHHPVRLAEQAALLDVVSGGRLEFGIGRGYQSRETEVLGGPMGATVQDQERNRVYFEEAYAILLKAWTEPSFSYAGEFFTIPPIYTKWHHSQTMAYFEQPETGWELSRVLDVGEPDPVPNPMPVMGSTTTLREISVFPQPLQKPYPQIWQPVASERSIRWAARHGVNCHQQLEPTRRLKRNIELFYEEAEKQGWPDRLGRGPFKFGWDAEKRRGYSTCRYVHILEPGNEKADLERFKASLEMHIAYFSAFGYARTLTDLDEEPIPLGMRVTGEMILEKGIVMIGTAAEVVEQIMGVKEMIGYEDFLFTCFFEMPGYTGAETEEQMRMFAAECMPALGAACGGLQENPEVGVELGPARAVS